MVPETTSCRTRWSPDSIELGPSARDLIDELSVAGIGPVRRLSDGRWGWLPVVLDGRRPGRTSIGWPLIPGQGLDPDLRHQLFAVEPGAAAAELGLS